MSINIIDHDAQLIVQRSDSFQEPELSDLQQNQLQQGMSHMHRSAPNIHELNFDYLQQNDLNDFIFNSCDQRQDCGVYFQEAQQVQSQEDEVHSQYQSSDIFDRIEHLSYDQINNSILEEENQSDELQDHLINRQDQLLDHVFNFNLKMSSNICKSSKFGDYHTDRVHSSQTYTNLKSRSLEKKKNGQKMKITKKLNSYYPECQTPENQQNSHLFSFKKKNAGQNKKKYQSFALYAKQSNILAEILPSNNLSKSLLVDGSVDCSLKEESQRSMGRNQYLSTYENQDKLLKKINKLVGLKVKTKNNKILTSKIINRQRKDLITKKNNFAQIDKQNSTTYTCKQSSLESVPTAQFKKDIQKQIERVKMFKRSSGLTKKNHSYSKRIQSSQISSLSNQKQHDIYQIELKEKNTKFSQNGDALQNIVKNIGINFEDKQYLMNQNFNHIVLSSPLLPQLSQKLTTQTFQLMIKLNRIYEHFQSRSSQMNYVSQNSTKIHQQSLVLQNLQFNYPLQKQINFKLENLEEQRKQVNLMRQRLKDQKQYLKKSLNHSDTFHSDALAFTIDLCNCQQQTLISKVKDTRVFPFTGINKKKDQIKSNFNLWEEIDCSD